MGGTDCEGEDEAAVFLNNKVLVRRPLESPNRNWLMKGNTTLFINMSLSTALVANIVIVNTKYSLAKSR